MKQVFFDGKGTLQLQDVPAPTCGRGQVLVRAAYSLISSGTESTALSGGGSLVKQALRRPDLVRRTLRYAARQGVRATVGLVRSATSDWFPLGYSAAGEVVEVGADVSSFAVGDRVACAGAGYANHAEFIAVPRNLVVKVPPGVPLREACFATVGAIALQGVRRAEPTLGETVVVVGTGLIGLLTAQLLRAHGCRVICTDLAGDRLQAARALGVEHTVLVGAVDPVAAVRAVAGPTGADAVILTAGTASSAPVNQAFQMCRERGRVVIVGAVGMNLERNDFYNKEIDLRISRSYGPGRYDRDFEEKGVDYPLGYVRWTETRNLAAFLEQVQQGRVAVAPLVSAEYPIEQAPEAYARVTGGDGIGVVLVYPGAAAETMPDRTLQLAARAPARDGRIGLALVGAGNYARLMHIPNLKRLGARVEVRAVVSGSGASARRAATELGAPLASTDLRAVLGNSDVDAVLIATRHDLHRKQCLAAARAGKHIFVEKPLALTVPDCEEIVAAVAEAGVLCAVGF
ncbi:MAG: bi-domain-containing oxidoreductase, partial [Anaerolineales bacterium]